MTIIGEHLAPYYIEVDSNNHTVLKDTEKVDKDGKIVADSYGYFSNLPGALYKIVRLKGLEGVGTTELSDLVARLEKIKDEVLKFTK